MIVAIQKGLGHLKDELRELGYDTVTYGEYNHPIDALVYAGSLDIANVTNSVSMTSANTHKSHGIFLVNANDKSASDIANILNRRTYTPLF